MLETCVGVWGSYTSTPLCNVLPIHNKVVPSSNISTYVRLQNCVHNPTWIMRSSPKFPVTCCFGLQRCCCISSCRRREENREGQEQAKTCRHDLRRAKKTSSECLPNLRAMESEIYRYVPIDTIQQENQFMSSKDPCCSGNNGNCVGATKCDRGPPKESGHTLLEDVFYLEHVGQVTVAISDSHLVWRRLEDEYFELDASALVCCRRTVTDPPWQLPVAEIFAVQSHGFGPVNQAKSPICGMFVAPTQLHRVEVHTFVRSDSLWIPKVYMFGHSSAAVTKAWTLKIQMLLDEATHRPKKLLVFVNPFGGKGSGVQTWEQVAPLFEKAKIDMTVVTTERAGHAHDRMESASKDELNALDGVVVVGGDGLFNEVLNGLVMHRHKAQAGIMPQQMTDFFTSRMTSNPENTFKDNMKWDSQRGGLKQLVVGDSSTQLENPSPSTSDQHPLLRSTPLPSLLENGCLQEGKNVGTSSIASVSRVGLEEAEPSPNDNALVLTARVKESELPGLANDASNGYCSISVTVPVSDENGKFLNPTSTSAEPTVGVKRKGEDLAVTSALNLKEIDLEESSATLVNSNPNLRIGIIPAGSTDTVVISTTGARDPITSALHIIIGDSMPLDIVRITGWKKQPKDMPSEKPEVRYAASFAGYGFYGDVMKESEALRWMGPARYDIAGFKVFMKHKSYEAEISFLDIPHSEVDPHALMPQGPWTRTSSFGKRKSSHEDNKKNSTCMKLACYSCKHCTQIWKLQVVCRVNCAICAKGFDFSHVLNSESDSEGGPSVKGTEAPTWRTCRAKFHSIGAAVMSCRNDKAPDGVAAHAHLADGLLHLILIRECSRPDYLRQLLRLTRRGADPFNFKFVEHYQTPVFTFLSHGEEQSMWNVDGELLPATQLTGQVFRGLVNLFARGPET